MFTRPANPGERRAHASTEFFRRPDLPAGVRYALLLREEQRVGGKPMAFNSLGGLARSIHRRRAEAGLQLADTELCVRDADRPRQGVSIWTTDPSTGEARKFLGWAYLGGSGRELLQAAIRENEPH